MRIRTALIFALVLGTSQPMPTQCQIKAIAMFRPGYVTIPPPGISCTVSEATVAAAPLQLALESNNVQQIERVFPGLSLDDTLGVNRLGEQITLIDMSNIFTLAVPDSGSLFSLLAELDTLGESGVINHCGRRKRVRQ